jgi:DNA-binding response OmpR family regulator
VDNRPESERGRAEGDWGREVGREGRVNLGLIAGVDEAGEVEVMVRDGENWRKRREERIQELVARKAIIWTGEKELMVWGGRLMSMADDKDFWVNRQEMFLLWYLVENSTQEEPISCDQVKKHMNRFGFNTSIHKLVSNLNGRYRELSSDGRLVRSIRLQGYYVVGRELTSSDDNGRRQ